MSDRPPLRQLGLFDDRPAGRDLQGDALRAKAEGQRAAIAARPDWAKAALAAVLRLAGSAPEFTTDDLHPLLPAPPPSPGALGAVVSVARRRGWIRDTGRSRQSARTESHARKITVWASRLCRVP